MTEAGPLELLSGDEGEDRGPDIKLPGVTKGIAMCVCMCLFSYDCFRVCVCVFCVCVCYLGDMSSRQTKPEIRVKSVQFSPTGMSLDHTP